MDEVIVVEGSSEKGTKFIERNEDRTCEIEVENRGIYKGFIESISSSGNYKVRLTEKLKDT